MRLCVFKYDKNDKDENVFCWPLEICARLRFREWIFAIFSQISRFFIPKVQVERGGVYLKCSQSTLARNHL